MATPQKLHEIAITLENEQRFHAAYKAARTSDGRSTAGSRRTVIRKFVDGKIIPTYLGTADVERLRRYFDDTMEMPKFVGDNQYEDVKTIEFWRNEVRNPDLKVASEPRLDAVMQRHLAELRAEPGFVQELLDTRELFRPMLVEKQLLKLNWARETEARYRWLVAELLKDQPTPDPSLCPRLIPLVSKLLKFSPSLRVYLKDMENTSDLKQFHEHLYGSAKKLGYGLNHSDYAPLIVALRAELDQRVEAGRAAMVGGLPKHVPDCPIPIPSPEYEAQWRAEQAAKNLNPQEPTMAKPIDITTKTLINGRDIKELSDSEVFQLIADEEARIAELEKIKAQPKKLVAEIEKRKAGIAALVAHLDAAV